MKPEPLRGKVATFNADSDGRIIAEIIQKKDVKSAASFYKRYRNNLRKLQKEQETIFNEYISSIEKAKSTTKEEYREWLFDISFKDVINNKMKKCPYCGGDGLDADDDDEGKTSPRRTCPQCKGTGGDDFHDCIGSYLENDEKCKDCVDKTFCYEITGDVIE